VKSFDIVGLVIGRTCGLYKCCTLAMPKGSSWPHLDNDTCLMAIFQEKKPVPECLLYWS